MVTSPEVVTTDGFKDWIQLSSFQWGVGRGVTSPHGSEDTREGSEPSISEVVVTKRMEKASPKLWQDAVGGDFSRQGDHQVHLHHQGQGGIVPGV